ncbi:type IV secretory system conjugative DNA transfer family protein [Bacillus pacificus]|nr:type IV secretory system conjugative DNA transfer family protein [Bacillus pacificus]
MLLDEFPRLGKVNGISQNLATLRSRNVHIVIIIQSLAQLDLIYGKDERKVFVDTCKYQLVLDATDSETQEYYSKMAGNQTVKVKSMSQSGEIWRSEQSFTTSEQSVPLIRPEEFGQLIQPILFVKGMKPIRVDKAFWYEDKELKPLVESQTA